MRIALWHNLPSGGGKRALYYQLRGLIERGHTVQVWCPPTADEAFLPLRDLAEVHTLPLDWPSTDATFPVLHALKAYWAWTRRIPAMDRHCQLCAEEINSGAFDLLLAHPCMYFRVTSIARHVRLPKVVYLQEPYRPLYEAMPRLPWAAPERDGRPRWTPSALGQLIRDAVKVQRLRVQVREERLNAQAFDTILVNSHFSRESVLRAYGLDARVCYLGVDTSLFVCRHQPREGFVVGLGAYVPEKNIALAIRAIAEVNTCRPRLVWVGNVANESYLDELKRLASSLGVTFEPRLRVGDDELVGLLNRAAVMVYAPRLEPFGLAPLEANACGLPVVAVAEGGVRETIVDGTNGLVVEHDPKAIASAIELLIGDRAYAAQLGERGSALVAERWSLEAAVDRLERRLVETLGSRSA